MSLSSRAVLHSRDFLFTDLQFEGEFRPLREYEEFLSGGDKAGQQSQEPLPSREERMEGDPDETDEMGTAIQLAWVQEGEER